jgi:tight adherence protein C
MLIWILLAALLIALSAALWLITRQDPAAPEAEKRFSQALETPQDETWLNQKKWRKANSLTYRFKKALERTPGTDMQEVETLMRQAALVSDKSRSLVYTSLWAAPMAAIGLSLLIAASQDWPPVQTAVFAFCFGFIAPRKLLRWIAENRKKAIREEMPIVLNLMRLLFDAGLSLENTLKAISEQGKHICPQLANEFAWVLTRIHHGQDRGAALEEMAQRIDVPELTETVAILKQAARYGGSLRESLLRYLRLMEERRLTDLRDKVGKLSAQMTIVMIVFMFPALMIFLAGPGAMAIFKALMQAR